MMSRETNRARKDRNILQHILEYCDRLLEYVEGLNEEAFIEDKLRGDACALCILQIGELVRILTDEFKEDHPMIPWKQIREMRNIVAHRYGEVDAETVWETIETDVPKLQRFCEEILSKGEKCPDPIESNGRGDL